MLFQAIFQAVCLRDSVYDQPLALRLGAGRRRDFLVDACSISCRHSAKLSLVGTLSLGILALLAPSVT
jgi:hypothetical protein